MYAISSWSLYFSTQIFQSFPFMSKPSISVILRLNSQGKENCQAHMILIFNVCPIFKHLTFYHRSKNDTSFLVIQLSKIFLLWEYNKTSLCCFRCTKTVLFKLIIFYKHVFYYLVDILSEKNVGYIILGWYGQIPYFYI